MKIHSRVYNNKSMISICYAPHRIEDSLSKVVARNVKSGKQSPVMISDFEGLLLVGVILSFFDVTMIGRC